MFSLGTVESEHLLHTAFESASALREHPPQLATPVAASSQHARHFAESPVAVIVITLDKSEVAHVVQTPLAMVVQIAFPIGRLIL